MVGIEERQVDERLLVAAISRAAVALSQDGHAPVVSSLRKLDGGSSGITLVAELGGQLWNRTVVVKVAPPGLVPVRNRDVLRQAAVMVALADSRLPVPRVLFTSAGDDHVPPFYGTEFVEGDAYEPIFDGPGRCSDEDIRSRSLHAARLLGQLHRLDPVALAIDPGPVVTPAEEVDRWVRAFESVPKDLRFAGLTLGRALARRVPDPVEPVIVHGDFRLGNMIARHGEVKSILDWEIWSLSDPRIDLAWFVTQADAASHPLACWQPPGMPSQAELVSTYQTERGTEMGSLRWFSALVRFKVAATSALIVKHARAQPAPDPNRMKWAPGIEPLVLQGLQMLSEERV
jgi:aminoglycoside phosphotransferase (APT) family kinase protein